MLSQQTIAMAGCLEPTINGSTRFTKSNKLRNNELRFGSLEAFCEKLHGCVKTCKSMNYITYARACPAFAFHLLMVCYGSGVTDSFMLSWISRRLHSFFPDATWPNDAEGHCFFSRNLHSFWGPILWHGLGKWGLGLILRFQLFLMFKMLEALITWLVWWMLRSEAVAQSN